MRWRWEFPLQDISVQLLVILAYFVDFFRFIIEFWDRTFKMRNDRPQIPYPLTSLAYPIEQEIKTDRLNGSWNWHNLPCWDRKRGDAQTQWMVDLSRGFLILRSPDPSGWYVKRSFQDWTSIKHNLQRHSHTWIRNMRTVLFTNSWKWAHFFSQSRNSSPFMQPEN
jgi:hypothetical protein